jgi:hypothetical protein
MAGLYGDWEADMIIGADEAQAEASSAMEKKGEKKKKKKKRKVIKGEDYAKTEESKAGVKKYQRRDRPYEGRKSDLAWLKKHGKARVSGEKE